MQDLFHLWSGDLSAGLGGDLATVGGPEAGQQRVLRRLLTNPGDYIWQPDYGAGLGGYVGGPVSRTVIAATIRSQMYMEPSVAHDPEPVIDVQTGQNGAVYVHIRYADVDTSSGQVLAFSVGA
jgi:phage baseplate assembly protein W